MKRTISIAVVVIVLADPAGWLANKICWWAMDPTVAAQVENDAAAASGRDALRLRALAETMKKRAESLR